MILNCETLKTYIPIIIHIANIAKCYRRWPEWSLNKYALHNIGEVVHVDTHHAKRNYKIFMINLFKQCIYLTLNAHGMPMDTYI